MPKRKPNLQRMANQGYTFAAFRSKRTRDEYADLLKSKGVRVEKLRTVGPFVEGGRGNAYAVSEVPKTRTRRTREISLMDVGFDFESFI